MDAPAQPSTTTGRPGTLADVRRMYGWLSRMRKRDLWLVLALSIVSGLAELAMIGAVVAFLRALTRPGVGQSEAMLTTGWFIGSALLAGALRLFLAWVSQSFVQRTGHELATEIQRRVLAQPYAYHLAHNSSDVVASLELVQQLTYGVIQSLLQAGASLVVGLFVFIAIASVNLPVAVIAAASLAITYAVLGILFRRPLDRRSELIAAAYGDRVRLVQESVGGIRDVIIDQSQAAHVDAFRTVDARLTKARVEAVVAGAAPRYLIETAGLILFAVVVLAMVRISGGLTAALPLIGALALGAQRLLPLVHQLYQGWSLAAAYRGVVTRIGLFLDLPVELPIDAAPQSLNSRLEFRQVSFTYSGRSLPAIDDVDLDVLAGSSVALIGPTGSGKSTLADLLMGLLTPTSGSILIDGRPLDPHGWQQSIAHVPQSIFLLDATIGRNIALGAADQPFDQDRARAAAMAAELGPFLQTLPEGIDTVVGERGVRLSGGQRQRIGIARALYKDAKVLILDEATSALDETTEARIVANLAAIPGLTLLVIAHRSSTVAGCDKIIRLDGGRLESVNAVG